MHVRKVDKESIFKERREFLEPVFRGNIERMLQEYRECEEECCVYWEPEFLTRYLKKDMESFKKEIRMRIPRIKAYEEKFRVIFGEYMGKCEVLYGEGGEEA